MYVNILWWVVYAGIAIVLQASAFPLPRLDYLLPAFILALQEQRPVQFVWVALCFVLIQEGLGSFGFGGAFLSYALAVALFFVGSWLFEVESFLFIFLLSACLGVTHYLVFSTMADLQNISINTQDLLDESVFQALITPFIWRLAYFTRTPLRRHEAKA